MRAIVSWNLENGMPGETQLLHPDGAISRPDVGLEPAPDYRVIEAHTYKDDSLVRVLRRYTLTEILDNPAAIPWHHEDGRQKTFLLIEDHGTQLLRCGWEYKVK